MKNHIITLAFYLFAATQSIAAQDTLWVRYDDRFLANGYIPLENVDSIEIQNSIFKLYDATINTGYKNQSYSSLVPIDKAEMTFINPGRYLLKPNTYSGTDYTNAKATSGYNFAHMVEGDHFAVFWDARYGENPTYIKHPDNGSVANAYTVLNICESCWNKYVELGFVKEGESTTDISPTKVSGEPMPQVPTELTGDEQA